MRGRTWKFAIIAVAVIAALIYLRPTFQFYGLSSLERQELNEKDPDRLEDLRSRSINLGLDLQGGIHLVLEVDLSKLKPDEARDAVDRAQEIITNRIDQFGVAEPVIQRQGDQRIVVELPGLQDIDRARNLIGQTALLEFKMLANYEDLEGLLKKIDEAFAVKPEKADTLEEKPKEGLFEEEDGLVEEKERPFTALLARYGNDLAAHERHYGQVRRMLDDPKVQDLLPPGVQFLWSSKPEREAPNRIYLLHYVRTKADMTGDVLADARVSRSASFETAGQPEVNFTTTDEGVKLFRRVTGAHIGERMAIVLDGKVYSAPEIRSKIPNGRGVITGSGTIEEAKDLAIVLRAGALPAAVDIIEDRTIGPSLGRDSIRQGRQAALIGLVVVAIFMVIYYGFAGIVADIALGLNMLFILSILAGFHATLTLPGIAGIILTIGMAVDANVLIFERIREELRTGKTIRSAIETGYARARSAILDSNITTFITAVVLYQFGTGPIKGFALTLMIGILSSLFTALFVTRVIFDAVTTRRDVRTLNIGRIQMLTGLNLGFIEVRKRAFLCSIGIIAVGLLSIVVHGGLNYGIDFAGGTLLELRFEPAVPIQSIRDALSQVSTNGSTLDLSRSEIKQFGAQENILIRVSEAGEEANIADAIKTKLKNTFPENIHAGTWERRQEKVGPKIGGELRKAAAWAVLLSMFFMIIYIWWRFRHIQFGIAAVAALVHDVVITLGVFSLLNLEISLAIVAALLTIVGYSLNDTIVVSDRIRENLRSYRRESYNSVVNRSINECLSRTIVTSLTTLIVVVILLLWGGEVIRHFALALTVGVLVGTYSSIFVASPILVEWQRKLEQRKLETRRARVAR